jgi:hypothetical protein
MHVTVEWHGSLSQLFRQLHFNAALKFDGVLDRVYLLGLLLVAAEKAVRLFSSQLGPLLGLVRHALLDVLARLPAIIAWLVEMFKERLHFNNYIGLNFVRFILEVRQHHVCDVVRDRINDLRS